MRMAITPTTVPVEDMASALIKELNHDYALELPLSSTASASASAAKTPEQRLAIEVSQKLRAASSIPLLDVGKLVKCFRSDAIQIQQRWVPKPLAVPGLTTPPTEAIRAQNSEERYALLKSLIDTLDQADGINQQPQPKKRRSKVGLDDERDGRPAQKARVNTGQTRPLLVDALPVRSTLSPERELDDAFTTFADIGLVTESAPAARASSAKARESKTQISPDQPTLQRFFKSTSKHKHISFTSRTGPPTPGPSNSDTPSNGDSDIELSEFELDDDLGDVSLETEDYDGAPSSLKHRLREIWPRFHVSGSEVAFAVQWEIMRIALYCGVDLRKADFDLRIGDDFTDQVEFRKMLKKQPAFAGKGFPPPRDDRAWKVALGTGQQDDKAVTYSADFSYNEQLTGSLYRIKLRPLALDLGHRMARRFGADRWLEVTIPSLTSTRLPSGTSLGVENRLAVVNWLTKESHHFLGRRWAAVFVSSDTKTKSTKNSQQEKVTEQVFYERIRFFATHGNTFQPLGSEQDLPSLEASLDQSDRRSMGLEKLLRWAIGISVQENQKQPALKLFSRLQLSFSQTTPTVVLEQHEIRHIEKSVGAKVDMADGAGRMSWALARRVAGLLGLSYVPCAFQARIGGCKGMWMIHGPPDDFIWIETWPSQRKFSCNYRDDLHRTFEVRDWVKPVKSSALNLQVLVVLESNAISKPAMRARVEHHLKNNLREELTSLREAMEEPAHLRSWIEQLGMMSSERSAHGHVKFLAGSPQSTAAEAAAMIDSGFDMRQKYLCDLVRTLLDRQALAMLDRLRIVVPLSAYAFMLPDFSGTLQENEVSFCMSEQPRDTDLSDQWDNWLEGDVLVGRAPTHFPSDMQRVRSVVAPSLRRFKDVVLFSIHGDRSLADKLSGGDFDGDQCIIIWDRAIVDQFKNEEVPSDLPNLDLKHDKTMFGEIIGEVVDEDQRARNLAKKNGQKPKTRTTTLGRACRKFIRSSFEFNVRPNLLGPITKFKERYAYMHSIKNRKVLQLSSLLAALVDMPKQGTLFDEIAWDAYRGSLALAKQMPKTAYEDARVRQEMKDPTRHILDWLQVVAQQEIQVFKAEFANFIDSPTRQYSDSHITRFVDLWSRDLADRKVSSKILTDLRAKVWVLVKLWPRTFGTDYATAVEDIYQSWCNIRPEPDFECLFKKPFYEGPNAREYNDFTMLKAAVTFQSCNHMPGFTFRMAGRQLRHLKGLVSGVEGSAPTLVVPPIYPLLKPNRKLIEKEARLRRAVEEEMDELARGGDDF